MRKYGKYVSFLTLGIQIFMNRYLHVSEEGAHNFLTTLPSPMAHAHIERYYLLII